MEIVFNPPKDVVYVPEIKKTLGAITIDEMCDSPGRKLIYAKTIELGTIVLWENAEYDSIGQWTDQDVIDRITELYQ